MEESKGFRRCDHCEGPECVAWDYMAWDCGRITGADRLVSREELFEAAAMGKSQTSGNLEKETAAGAANTDDGKETPQDD